MLDKNGKKVVPISGQDASIPGLQNILLGKQTGTVYKPYQLEARPGVGARDRPAEGPEADRVRRRWTACPVPARRRSSRPRPAVEKVVNDGNAKASDICTADVAAACTKYGIK